jgi:hypothetical protein
LHLFFKKLSNNIKEEVNHYNIENPSVIKHQINLSSNGSDLFVSIEYIKQINKVEYIILKDHYAELK